MMFSGGGKSGFSWLGGCLMVGLAWTLCMPAGICHADDIVIEQSGLHDHATVFGLDISALASPYANADNYSILATGDDTGAYSDVSFSVAGIYAQNPVDIENSGVIELEVEGGVASSASMATAAVGAAGIATGGAVNNAGTVLVLVAGGDASVAAEADTEVSALGMAGAIGIASGGAVDNSGGIMVAAFGGNALVTPAEGVAVTGISNAATSSMAIGAEGDVNNSGQLMAVAMGGAAEGAPVAFADANAIGIEAEGAIVNSGNLFVGAIGGMAGATNTLAGAFASEANASAEAMGIESETGVTNSGALMVIAEGGEAEASDDNDAEATAGGEAGGIFSDGDVSNSGAISAVAMGGSAAGSNYAYAGAFSFGIHAVGAVDNSGDILVRAEGGDAATESSYADAEAEAFGIHSYASVNNTGAIVVQALGGSGVSESGVNSYEYAVAYGIRASGDVTNGGAIEVMAVGGTSDDAGESEDNAFAYGISAGGVVANTAALTVTAAGGSATGPDALAGATAVGIYSNGGVDRRVDGEIAGLNSGAITVSATGGTAAGADSSADAYAAGIVTAGDLTNSGAIVVTATGGTAAGEGSSADADAAGIYVEAGTAFVDNSANITVTATADEGYEASAAGIVFEAGGSLTNTGIIQAFGDTKAYEVAVMSGTVTLVDSYNLNLDGDPTVGSLYVGEGAELVLNDALLSVTAMGGTTLLNTEYQIFDTTDGGIVTGSFGGLIAPLNPDVAPLYHDQDTENSADDTVSLAYQPGASPQLEGVGLLRNIVNLSADLVGQRITTGFLQTRMAAHAPRYYAAADSVVSDAGAQPGRAQAGGFFFTPYYANLDKDAAPAGYDADMVGFVSGVERERGGNLYGFHLGFGHAGIDYTGTGYSENQEDQELLSAGLHLMGGRDDWTWRAQVTGFYGWHDYDGLTGANLELHEDADYDSYGVRTALLGGHLFERGGQILLPEVGVEYLWLHRDGFTTDADDPNWDLHSDSLDEHQVSALASLRWLTVLQSGEVEVTPSLAAGVRYLVTDDELDVSQSVAGSGPVTVKSDQDEVTGTLSASVRFRKEQLATELAYGGEFGDDTTMHSAWIRFRYLF